MERCNRTSDGGAASLIAMPSKDVVLPSAVDWGATLPARKSRAEPGSTQLRVPAGTVAGYAHGFPASQQHAPGGDVHTEACAGFDACGLQPHATQVQGRNQQFARVGLVLVVVQLAHQHAAGRVPVVDHAGWRGNRTIRFMVTYDKPLLYVLPRRDGEGVGRLTAVSRTRCDVFPRGCCIRSPSRRIASNLLNY